MPRRGATDTVAPMTRAGVLPRLPLIAALFSPLLLLACSSDEPAASSSGAGGSGGAGASSATSGAGGAASATSSSGAGAGPCGGPIAEGPCAPDVSKCAGAASSCLALELACETNPRLLRVSELAVSAPAGLTGAVGNILAGAARADLEDCYLKGSGTFSWLLQLDAAKSTLKLGTAPGADTPESGYCFETTSVDVAGTPVTVVPVIVSATVDASGVVQAEEIDSHTVVIDLGGTYLPLPLRALRFVETLVSADGACIGQFNAANLRTDNLCLPEDGIPSFLPGGKLEAYITLEESDGLIIETLGMSVCALLTGTDDGGAPKRCPRTAGVIDVEGDWCAQSNDAASPTCHDAVHFMATFAAGAVPPRGDCQ